MLVIVNPHKIYEEKGARNASKPKYLSGFLKIHSQEASTCLNKLLFVSKIIFYFFTKQTGFERRSTVLSLPFN